MPDTECLVTSSVCLFFTILSVCGHALLGVFYYFATGTTPAKEKILSQVSELKARRLSREVRHAASEQIRVNTDSE
jgi:hypothetical protein